MLDRGEVKFLVIDYDGCAHSNYDVQRSDWLSPQLIEYAQNGGYSGFYGCTHRCYYGQSNYIYLQDCLGINTKFMKNDLTCKITENFNIATRLKCMAVSTQDDAFYSSCGDAYESIIKPYEEKRQLPSSEKKYINSIWQIWSHHGSKNPQLIQIARHAAKNIDPETPITLDYIDDRQELCAEATKVTANENWPKNIRLNVYQHYANSNIMLFNQCSKQQEITETQELTFQKLYI